MDKLTFYREWLPLKKGEFRIMAMLADKGKFSGNLSDLCRYFFVSPQTRNRNSLVEQINALEQSGYITVQHTGRTYTLTAIPKAKKIIRSLQLSLQLSQTVIKRSELELTLNMLVTLTLTYLTY